MTTADASSPSKEAENKGPVGIPSGYQPALDGVRAIAVGLVVLFHFEQFRGSSALGGGWLGVDMFFVLSGYLITSLLLTEQQRNGRVDLKRFYVRRFLRLAPLSIALVIVVLVINQVGLADDLGLELPFGGAISILFYYSNWWFIAHSGGLGVLGHAWSLSVEEQFYLLWPGFFYIMFLICRRHARWILITLVAASIVIVGLVRRHLWLQAVANATSGPELVSDWIRFMLSSFIRPDGLLFGCLLALVLHGITVTPRIKLALSVSAVLACGIAVWIISRALVRPPWAIVVPIAPKWAWSLFNLSVALIIASLVTSPDSKVARVLSIRPMTWVGRRSYGIYLLHNPVYILFSSIMGLSGRPFEAMMIIVVLVVAGLSFRFFESPFLKLKERFASP